ncbi:MAG TPA: Uma2 family endonuclease [Candidatus Solibacter sp.]|nr:Uma2 family endonuclease [Candidatus Solibacter sp.]
MAASPTPPLVSVEEYLHTSYPDGDREYLDGVVVNRNLGTPAHSVLQKILTVHFAAYEKQFDLAVRPECRTLIEHTCYREPDLIVMKRPFQQSDRVIFDTPLLIVEILSPNDTVRSTMHRFRDYDRLGVPYIIQMDPEDRTTFVYVSGDLVRRDLTSIDVPGGAQMPFDSRALLAKLEE